MLAWYLLNHAWFQFLNPLPISSFLTQCSSLFVFPHVLLIIIGKIIFHLFPQLPCPLSFFPPFLPFLAAFSFFFIPHLSSPTFPLQWYCFLFFKFLVQICFSLSLSLFFFQILYLFGCFNPFSHSLALLSLSLSSLGLLSFHLFSPFFLLVLFFFFLYLFLLSFSTSYPYYTNVMISSVFLVISLFFLLLLLFILLFSLLHFQSSNLFPVLPFSFLSFHFLFFLIFVVSTQFSSFISFAKFEFIITMLFIFFNSYLFSPFPLFSSFSSSSFSPFSLFSSSSSYPITSLWWFPQFSLSFPGSRAPRSRTLSIPDLYITENQ